MGESWFAVGRGYSRAGFLNANSLKTHIQEIRKFLMDDFCYHLFGIVESKLGPVVEDYLIQIDGYTLVRQDRKVRGGGVALYLRNTLKVKILEISNTIQTDECDKPLPQPEYLMFSVLSNCSPVFR